MKKLLLPLAALLFAAPMTSAFATQFNIEITNLTNANYFTPILVSAHRQTLDMFEPGEPADDALQAIAEGGDISLMQTALEDGNAAVVVADVPAAPFLGPGETATAVLNVNGQNRKLSLAAMILPTNDAFIGLDSMDIRTARSKTIYLYGYDAGTEANDELLNPGAGGVPGVAGIPGDPSGLGGILGTGVSTADNNHTVHIHRGIVGDDDPSGGISDLDRLAHRWLNPVAKVVVKRVSN